MTSRSLVRLALTLVAAGAAVALVSASGPVRAQVHPPSDASVPVVFQAAGPNIASIQSALDQFRLALGGVNNGNTAGPLAEGRREINWDGGGSTATSPAPTPFAGFQTTRGALFTTPGSGFVQSPLAGLPSTFGNLTYESIFQAFSPVRVFSPVASNITDVTFFVPGAPTTAATRAFGAVFTDVDQQGGAGAYSGYNREPSTFVEYSGVDGRPIFRSAVPASPGNAGVSFFGAVFADARIGSVRIVAGNVAPGPFDENGEDIVMMDDFVYGEPQAAAISAPYRRR